MPRTRIIVLLLLALAVAATFGVGALLGAGSDGDSRSGITQTAQPLPPARSVVKDVPPALIPSYQAGAAECPRVPWTFYAAMGKLSSDHGRDLPGGQVRVEDRLVRGVVTLTEGQWARYHRSGSYDSPRDTLITVARLLCSGPAPSGPATMDEKLAIRYVSEIRYVSDALTVGIGSLLAQAAAYARLYQ